MNYIGIDPGVTGGIALIRGDGEVRVFKMPPTEADLLCLLLPELATDYDMRPAVVMLEKAQTMPGMGVVGAFTYGKGYGAIRMALAAARIPYDEVTSPVWQKALQCRSRGDKNVTKRRAQELFPDQRITHATADALLLAEYCRRVHRGLYATDPDSGQKERQHGKAEGQGKGERFQQAIQEDIDWAIDSEQSVDYTPGGFAAPAAAGARGDGGRPDQGTGRRRGQHRGRPRPDGGPSADGSAGSEPGTPPDEKASQEHLAGARRRTGAGAGRRKAARPDVAGTGDGRGRGRHRTQ